MRTTDERLLYDPDLVERMINRAVSSHASESTGARKTLSDWIPRGSTVLLKPNWVLHRNKSGHSTTCLVTHPAFVLAALKQVVRAGPARIVLGDAPIQSCNWEALVAPEFRAAASRLAADGGVDLTLTDFRRTIAPRADLVGGVKSDARDAGRFIRFDLAVDSLLEPVSTPEGCFRVTNYDPRELARTHRPGRHQYVICEEALQADVIVSLPKLKTHCKVGLTGALKNFIGVNGSKDYLPHHRVGGTADRGDCYPGRSHHRRWAERCLDNANRRIGRAGYRFWRRLALMGWDRIAVPREGRMEGSWYGNDTVWRTALDVHRVVRYGKADGSMADTPQRTILYLTDAIECGQGDGPLAPEPLRVGAVTFGCDAPAADWLHATLLRLDPARMPLIREAFGAYRWPLSDTPPATARVDGRLMSLDEVARTYGVAATPAPGWRGHLGEPLLATAFPA